MKILFYVIALSLLSGCGWVVDTAKDTVKAGGEVAGEVAGEFVEGISDGVEEGIKPSVELHEELDKLGLELGEVKVEGFTNKNTLQVYLIMNANVSRNVRVIAYNSEGKETGRVQILVEGKAGEAGYFEAKFSEKTHIESSSTIRILPA